MISVIVAEFKLVKFFEYLFIIFDILFFSSLLLLIIFLVVYYFFKHVFIYLYYTIISSVEFLSIFN